MSKKFNSYSSIWTFITFANNRSDNYFNQFMINGTLRITNFLDDSLSIDTDYFHRKKRENQLLHTGTNEEDSFSKSKVEIFPTTKKNTQQPSFFFLPRGSIRSIFVGRDTTSTHNNFFSFPLPPNQITESSTTSRVESSGWQHLD